jgi:DNA-binding NarL/FixJ family response regulator
MIRVLIADDQQLIREGLKALLESERDIVVVAEAADGAACVSAFASSAPDVVLMDIKMPGMDGIEATRRIREMRPDAKILVLTTFDEDRLVLVAIRAGARGYYLKDLSGPDLAAAIRELFSGGAALQPGVALKVMNALSRGTLREVRPEQRVSEPLSARERSVLALVAKGLSNKEIAVHLFLAEGTVKNHVSTILQKIGARDRTQAALIARDLGLLDEPQRE